jgi:hypothetical protein
MYDNFARIHKTLRVIPGMEAGASKSIWTPAEIVGRLCECSFQPRPLPRLDSMASNRVWLWANPLHLGSMRLLLHYRYVCSAISEAYANIAGRPAVSMARVDGDEALQHAKPPRPKT